MTLKVFQNYSIKYVLTCMTKTGKKILAYWSCYHIHCHVFQVVENKWNLNLKKKKKENEEKECYKKKQTMLIILKGHDHSALLQKPKAKCENFVNKQKCSVKHQSIPKTVRILGVSHLFSWNSKFLQKLNLQISYVKKN